MYCKDLKSRGNYGIFVLRRYLIYQYCPNVYKKNYILQFFMMFGVVNLSD